MIHKPVREAFGFKTSDPTFSLLESIFAPRIRRFNLTEQQLLSMHKSSGFEIQLKHLV